MGIFDQTQFQKPVNVSTIPVNSGKKVNLVDADGKFVGSAFESDLPTFLNQGYHVENAEQKEVNDYLEENKGLSGSLKTAGYNAANELSFGALNPAVEGLADKSTIAKIKGLQRDHSTAAALGTGAGLVGSMFVPGLGLVNEAGKAAEAFSLGGRAAESFGSKALSSAVKMGTEGAILAAPQALSEAAFGDPQEAAEHLLFGLGAGALLGAASPVLKGAGKALVNAVGAPIGYRMESGLTQDLAKMSENQAERSIFTNQNKQLRGELNKINDEKGIKVGRYLLDNNLIPTVGEDTTSYLARVQAHKEAVGKQVGDVVDLIRDVKAVNTDELIAKMRKEIEPLSGSAAKKTEYEAANRYIDDFETKLKEFDGSTAMGQNYQNKLNEFKSITDPVQKEIKSKEILALRDQLIADNANVTLGKIWKESSDLGNKIFKEKGARLGNPNALNEELTSLRNVIKDTIKYEGAKVAKANDIPDWVNQFDAANRNFRVSSAIEDVAQNSANAASNRNFSLTDNIWGSAIGAGNIHGLLTNPLGVATGVIGAVGSKFIRENGNKLLSEYGNKASLFLADMAKKEAEGQLGRIPTMLKQFAKNTFSSTGVQETGNAIARFIGSQEKDPVKSYNELSAKLQNVNANGIQSDLPRALADGTPNIANAYNQANNNVLSYLNKVIPKDPNAGKPYSKPFVPTKFQLSALNDKLSVINNPFIVMDKLGSGKLNQNHMEALKAIYPKVYNNMVNKVNEYGLSNPDMPYKAKLRLSVLTGSNLDNSLNNIPQYQAQYQEENKPAPLANGKLKEVPGSQYTQQQRTEGDVDV